MAIIYEVRNLTIKARPAPGLTRDKCGALPPILEDVSFKAEEGEFLVISGPNGSGKTLLLMALIGVLKPDSGQVIYRGEDLFRMKREALVSYRRLLGVVFQDHKLIDRKTVKDNVALVPFSQGLPQQEVWKRTYNVLKGTGLLDYQLYYPDMLSAGTKQRLAVARALVNEPSVILADEPLSGVDSAMEKEIIDLLFAESEKGKTVLFFTSKVNSPKGGRIRRVELKK